MAFWDNDPIAPSDATPQAAAPFWANDPVATPPDAGDPDQVGAINSVLDAAQPKSTSEWLGMTGPGLKAIGGAANEVANSVSRGIPFSDRISAGLQTGLNDVAPSLGNGKDYSANLADERAQAAAALAANPIGERVGNFAGAAVLPAGVASRALQGATLGAKVGMGAVGGASVGALQGASSTPDLMNLKQTALDTGKGAAIGGFVGGAAPLVGAGIGAGASKLYSMANSATAGDLSSPAQRLANKALSADGPATVQATLDKLGPDAMLVDAGPNFQGIGQGLVVKPGDARATVTNALKSRDANMNTRVNSDVDAALGPAQSPLAATEALKAQRSAVHDALPQVWTNAPPVDTTNVLTTIGSGLTKAVGPEAAVLQKARDYLMTQLPDGSAVPVRDAETLNNAKMAIDKLIDYGDPTLGVTPGAVSKSQGSIGLIRKQLNGALRDQVPGYSDVMDESSAIAQQMDAIERGTKSLRGGTAAIHPDDFSGQYGALPQGPAPVTGAPNLRTPVQAATNLGMRGAVDNTLGARANDFQAVKGLLQGEDGWNAQNIGTAFGPDAQASLQNMRDREGTFADTTNKLIQNSQTAQRTGMAKDLADADSKPLLHLPLHDVTGHGMILGTGQSAINKIADLIRGPVDNAGRDADLARLVTATGSTRNQMLADALKNYQSGQQAAAIGSSAAKRAALAAALAPNAALSFYPQRAQ